MNRKAAKQLTERMDRVANYVEKNYPKLGLTKKEAFNICETLDKMSNVLDSGELATWTAEYEEDLTPASPDMDSDLELQPDEESYMDHYNAPSELEEGDEDEDSYMDHYNGSDFDNVHDYVLQDRKASKPSKPASRKVRASDEDEDHEAGFSFFAEEDEDEDHESSLNLFAEEDEDDHEAGFSFFAEEDDEDDHEASLNLFASDDEDEDYEASRRSSRSRFAEEDEDEDKEATRTSSWQRKAEKVVQERQAARKQARQASKPTARRSR